MEDAQRLLNPWVLHLQKLGLELKCPLCLELFKRPVLLPCNHIFCNSCKIGTECPVCKHLYADRDVKPALFMENIVTIYRNLEATFNANGSAENYVARKFEKCNTPESVQKQEFKGKDCDKPSRSSSNVHAEKHMETGVDVGFIQMEQLSPPLSSDSKDVDGNYSGDPIGKHKDSARYSAKRSVDTGVYETNLESNGRCTSGAKCQTPEGKRQKKTKDGLNDMKLEKSGHPHTNDLVSENVATTSCNSQTKSGKPPSGEQSSVLNKSPCAFCHSSKKTEGSGPLVAYAQGKQVPENVANSSKATYVHEKCIGWAPQIFFKDGIIKNLEAEVRRGNKLKCTSCGKKGAVLGCYVKSCQNTYHVPCAYDIYECRWDCVEYLLLCPEHASSKFPSEQKAKAGKEDAEKRTSTNLNPGTTLLNAGKNLLLCGSALSADEKFSLVEFASSSGVVVSKYWRQNVTHVIASTDSNGACTRTLKVLMAILNGKWILTTEWVKACVEAGQLVKEEPYEVQLDTHGSFGGPKAGRLRIQNNAPKLFNNLKFYFVGDFVPAFKNDLLNLVITAGGTITETKDKLRSSSNDGDTKPNLNQVTLVGYNADFSDNFGVEDEDSMKFQRLAAAEDVAQEFGSKVVGHTWILESIASCCLLPFTSSA